ncbi:SdpI family protein [Arthrobacter sp. G119Y2]|uniref:SdpI family protein n=1 Tax=Arthrobacter sp. G119Y2 TaxID=3134965 RepID=UPI0031194522
MAAGIAISWAAEATARGRLGMNPFVGIRVGYVTHSPEAWLAGHRSARWPTHAAAGIIAACGILILALNVSDETASRITIGGSLAVFAMVLFAAKKATRAAELVVVQNADQQS